MIAASECKSVEYVEVYEVWCITGYNKAHKL
jgi:hypothetical protein